MTKSKNDRPRVLLVDDYPDAREMYSEYLQFSGFDVIEAANGMEALQRAADEAPDIILMDLSLPVMDGWEATRRLKADRRTAEIPVVALTGHALAGISEGARQAGCDAFVTKPCLPEDLVREIRKVLEGLSSRKAGRSGKYAKTNYPASGSRPRHARSQRRRGDRQGTRHQKRQDRLEFQRQVEDVDEGQAAAEVVVRRQTAGGSPCTR